MTATTAGLTIEADRRGDDYVIRLIGEFALPARETIEAAIRAGEESGATRIVIDLDDLDFIDSIGLSVLLAVKRRADGTGSRLRFTRGTGQVAHLFRLTALDRVLPFVDSGA